MYQVLHDTNNVTDNGCHCVSADHSSTVVGSDPALHGCGEECCRTCESRPDTCRHIGPATVCLGKADSVEVAREVW